MKAEFCVDPLMKGYVVRHLLRSLLHVALFYRLPIILIILGARNVGGTIIIIRKHLSGVYYECTFIVNLPEIL